MQSFVVTEASRQQADAISAVFAPVSGFTAVDLGYQRGNAISNFLCKKSMSQISQRSTYSYSTKFGKILRNFKMLLKPFVSI